MTRFKLPRRLLCCWGIVTLLSTGFLVAPAQAGWFSWFSRKSGWGPASGNSKAAGHRGGECPPVNTPLISIAPIYSSEGNQFILAATTSSAPTLWFYLPYALTDRLSAELRLEQQSESGDAVQTTVIDRLPPTPKPGIIGVQLPPLALQLDRTYHWLLVVICDPNDASANRFAELSLRRVSLSELPAEPLPVLKRLTFYSQNGLWEPFLTSLARERCRAPQNSALAATWQQSLQEIGLAAIANQPIVNCTSIFPADQQ